MPTPSLGVKLSDLFGTCHAIQGCPVVTVRDVIDIAEQLSGEYMIHRIVDRLQGNHTVTENEWNSMINEQCRTNYFLHEFPNFGLGKLLPCIPGHITRESPAFKTVIRDYIQEYCNRVSRV